MSSSSPEKYLPRPTRPPISTAPRVLFHLPTSARTRARNSLTSLLSPKISAFRRSNSARSSKIVASRLRTAPCQLASSASKLAS